MAVTRKTTKAASEVKEETKKPGRKSSAETKEPAKRTTAKKETAKTASAKKVEEVKEAVKEIVTFQFGGKSYTTDDLLKSCKDVWKYDLDRKEEDIKSIELYVNPEENVTYYVINGAVNGSFPI